jgi:multicomponent Na+:H+ antiporter subunit D
MLVAMGIGAFFCTLFGVYPDLLYRFLPYEVTYNPYTVYHLVEMIQILVFTFIGFWILRKKLEGEALIALDTDWFYRRSAPLARRVFVSAVAGFFDGSERVVKQITMKTISWVGGSGSRQESDMFQILAGVLIVFVLLGTLLVLN